MISRPVLSLVDLVRHGRIGHVKLLVGNGHGVRNQLSEALEFALASDNAEMTELLLTNI